MKPNILFILSDQHSPHALGCEGHPLVQTPRLDALAAQSVVMENCYCQNPVCAPSRACLLTGQYSKHTGVYGNAHLLEHNLPTFPRVLSRAGYRTCLIGKGHFNGEPFHGYQQRPYGDLFGQAHQPDPCRDPECEAGLGDLLAKAGPSGIPIAMTQTEICVAEATRWLQGHVSTHAPQPFLLSVHLDKPHFPLNPPQRFFDLYDAKVELPDPPATTGPVPTFVSEQKRRQGRVNSPRDLHRRALAAYLGCVTWVDDAVGRILDVLDYLGLAENTLVVYSSDHGEMGFEHGVWQKTLFYDASARVPMMVRWPGTLQPRRTAELAQLIDLFPTFCELAGAEVPEAVDGQSLMPILHGRQLQRDAIFSESVVLRAPELAGCMIRAGRWKYNLYLDGGEELYDLQADPQELVNLAADAAQASRVGELRSRVEAFWQPHEQLDRYDRTPAYARERHFYPWSNQFVMGDGAIADARP